MKVFRTLTLMLVGVSAGLLVGSAGGAQAALGTTICKDTTFDNPMPAGTYGKVVVPAGEACYFTAASGLVDIRGGVYIEAGATFVLGDHEIPDLHGRVSGGVHATDPASVRIHFSRINGGVDIHGGSGPFGGPEGITWIAIEDDVINGGATVDGYNGFWFGFLTNVVHGTVNLNDNVSTQDPDDSNEFVSNIIKGNLNCTGNSPAPQVGDSEGGPNTVTGHKNGQCAAPGL